MRKHKKTKPNPEAPKPLHEPKSDAAGIDLGATEIWAAVAPDRCRMPVRRFGAFMQDLMAILQWLLVCGIRTVAMEATGVYWIPLYQLLADAGIEHEHVVPEDLRTDRAGILPYQNPDLVAEIVGESREAIVGNHLYTAYFFGRDEKARGEKRSFTAHEIFSTLDSREQISRSLARMRATESSIRRILTAISNRPIANAPVLLEKRKSNGKLLMAGKLPHRS